MSNELKHLEPDEKVIMLDNVIKALDVDLKKFSSPERLKKMVKIKKKVYERSKKHFEKLTRVKDPRQMPELSLRPVNHDISRQAIKRRPLPDASMRFSNSEILKIKVPQRDLLIKMPGL